MAETRHVLIGGVLGVSRFEAQHVLVQLASPRPIRLRRRVPADGSRRSSSVTCWSSGSIRSSALPRVAQTLPPPVATRKTACGRIRCPCRGRQALRVRSALGRSASRCRRFPRRPRHHRTRRRRRSHLCRVPDRLHDLALRIDAHDRLIVAVGDPDGACADRDRHRAAADRDVGYDVRRSSGRRPRPSSARPRRRPDCR